ncbi:MAG: type II toxin-antitoxin system HicB family antitoxin [Rhodospirillales bacterium]|nr:type II toxin-antitoxin system HicB family antitoxin [Rhodospirillales bacterium]
MRYAYPAAIVEEPEGFTVTFPDVPEAITAGATRAEALERACDVLVTALSFYVGEEKPLPRPSAAHGRPVVFVPVLEAAKLALHDAMLAARLSNVELARRMGRDEKAIRRLRDLLHASHIEDLEAALRMLGRRLEVNVLEAA